MTGAETVIEDTDIKGVPACPRRQESSRQSQPVAEEETKMKRRWLCVVGEDDGNTPGPTMLGLDGVHEYEWTRKEGTPVRECVRNEGTGKRKSRRRRVWK